MFELSSDQYCLILIQPNLSKFVQNGPDWSKLVLIGRWGPCLFSHDGQRQPPQIPTTLIGPCCSTFVLLVLISYNWFYVAPFGGMRWTYLEDILIIIRLMSGKQQMKQLYVLFNKCINKWGTKGRVPKKTTKVWTYVQTGSTLPTQQPSMDKKKFGLLLSTLPTYLKSLDIFVSNFVLKHIYSCFCQDTIG